jgi:hypothetical protein
MKRFLIFCETLKEARQSMHDVKHGINGHPYCIAEDDDGVERVLIPVKILRNPSPEKSIEACGHVCRWAVVCEFGDEFYRKSA